MSLFSTDTSAASNDLLISTASMESTTSTATTMDAEALCKMIREHPEMVRIVNGALGFRSTATDDFKGHSAVDEEDEPATSNVKILRCRNDQLNQMPPRRRVVFVQSPGHCNERISGWTNCFAAPHKATTYAHINANGPITLPFRTNAKDFVLDPPISEAGRVMSQLIGRAINNSSQAIDRIFSSPDLASLQTAAEVRAWSWSGRANNRPSIKIEPGLLDMPQNAAWQLPSYLSTGEANRGHVASLNVDAEYQPVFSVEAVRSACGQHTVQDTEERIFATIRAILASQAEDKQPTTVLIVATAMTIDCAIQHLQNLSRDEGKSSASSSDNMMHDDEEIRLAEFEIEDKDAKSWKRVWEVLPVSSTYGGTAIEQ